MRISVISLIVSLIALPALTLPKVGFSAVAQRDVLIKGESLSAVYYLASDDKRYVFPNEKVYKSWFTTFDGVIEVTDEELASFPLGGNVTYRPGIKMVKITSDPKTYAVGRNGTLRWVTSESVATSLFGSDWNTKIDDLSDAFFFNYKIGTPIYFSSDFSPVAEANAATTINTDKGLPKSVSARLSDTSTLAVESADYGFTDDIPLSKPEVASRMRPMTAYLETSNSFGSGFVIDSEGHILTNAHVVKGVHIVDIYLPGTGTFTGSVVGRDEYVDLALIKPNTTQGLPYATFSDSSLLQAGDEVFAMGYPLIGFQEEPSFTAGYFSRMITGQDFEALETSATIHPGNSGGPLVDVFGKVVGINTWNLPDLKNLSGALNLAIPINKAKLHIPLLKDGLQNVIGGATDSTDQEPTPEETQPEENQCTADTWSCTEWSECSQDGTQTRTCTKAFECSEVETPKPPETQSCTPPPPEVPGVMSFESAPDDTESEPGIVIGGNSNVVLGKWRLTAQNESLKLRKIWVQLADTNNYPNLQSLSLYDGATLVAGPTPVNSDGYADFSGFEFVVPVDDTKTLTIKGTTNSISGGAESGSNLKILLHIPGSDDGTFEYRGVHSDTVVKESSDGDQIGNDKILRKTKPTVSLAALPSTTLTSGSTVVSRLTVTADSAENVSLKSVTWDLSRSGALGITSPKVREVGSTDTASAFALDPAGDSDCDDEESDVCTVVTVFDSEQIISAGTSKTYELVVTASAVDSNDAISTTVSSSGDAVVTGELDSSVGSSAVDGDSIDAVVNGTDGTFSFIWSDNSAVPHNDTVDAGDGDDSTEAASNDWTNGYLVKVLPTDAQTVQAP